MTVKFASRRGGGGIFSIKILITPFEILEETAEDEIRGPLEMLSGQGEDVTCTSDAIFGSFT